MMSRTRDAATLRTLHFGMGIAGVLIFLFTGQVMAHHEPPMEALTESGRLLYRSRHIYILGSALVNLMVGLYLLPHPARWRTRVQAFGSILLLASPVALTMAFFREPQTGFRQEMWWSSAGLYLLFGGALSHLLSGRSARAR